HAQGHARRAPMKSRGFGWRSLRLCEKCVFPRVAKSDGVRLSDTEICDRVDMSFSCGAGWQGYPLGPAGWQPASCAGKQPARSVPSCPTIEHFYAVTVLA